MTYCITYSLTFGSNRSRIQSLVVASSNATRVWISLYGWLQFNGVEKSRIPKMSKSILVESSKSLLWVQRLKQQQKLKEHPSHFSPCSLAYPKSIQVFSFFFTWNGLVWISRSRSDLEDGNEMAEWMRFGEFAPFTLIYCLIYWTFHTGLFSDEMIHTKTVHHSLRDARMSSMVNRRWIIKTSLVEKQQLIELNLIQSITLSLSLSENQQATKCDRLQYPLSWTWVRIDWNSESRSNSGDQTKCSILCKWMKRAVHLFRERDRDRERKPPVICYTMVAGLLIPPPNVKQRLPQHRLVLRNSGHRVARLPASSHYSFIHFP